MRIIRADMHQRQIKVQSKGTYGHGWKTLEKFITKEQLEKRMTELLKDKNTTKG